MGVAQSAPQGGSLPRRHYLLTPLTENKEASKESVILWVRPTPTRFPINILYTPPLEQVLLCKFASGLVNTGDASNQQHCQCFNHPLSVGNVDDYSLVQVILVTIFNQIH